MTDQLVNTQALEKFLNSSAVMDRLRFFTLIFMLWRSAKSIAATKRTFPTYQIWFAGSLLTFLRWNCSLMSFCLVMIIMG